MKKPILIIILIVLVVFGGVFMLDKYHSSKSWNTSKTTTTLANPASVYCHDHGGISQIITLGNGAQDGLCNFEDNYSCEEWAMMRGNCPMGGVRTTGYDNEGQMYCAWLGGKTLAVPNSQCELPNGHTCSTDSLWAGTCN